MTRRTSRSRGGRINNNVVRLDLSKVESRARVKPGEYETEVVEVTREKGQAADYLKWVFEITEGDSKGGKLFYNTSLAENALWNLRGLLEALDVEIPDSEFDLDLKDVVGAAALLTVEEGEEYQDDNGRWKKGGPAVVDFAPLEDDGDDHGGGKKSDAKEERTSSRSSRRSNKDEDDDKGGKRERTSRRGGKKEAEKPTVSQDEINDMSQEELEELCDEYKLEVELEGTLRKMKAKVIDAMDKAGHLDEE